MSRASKTLCVLLIAFVAFVLVESQTTSYSISRSRSRSSRQSQTTTTTTPTPTRSRSSSTTFGHRVGIHHRNHTNRTKQIRPNDRDKYYDEYEYEDEYDEESATSRSREDEENKFIEEGSTGIVLDHVEFVLLRLKTILKATTSNLTNILEKQKEEFKLNPSYKEGWEAAVREYRKNKKAKINQIAKSNSIVKNVPEEYHIAILAYTLGEPSMYADFNRETRQVCSGTDIDNYHWKSYFKLLHLAIKTLASHDKYRDNRRFLYRGATLNYKLKEGQVIAFQHFISTSAALNIAEKFADNYTLFEFQGLYNGTAMNIEDFSFYVDEQETLFSPVQIFKVDSIHVGNHYTRYVLVKDEAPPLCDLNRSESGPEDERVERIDVKDNSLKYSAAGNSLLNEKYHVLLLTLLSLLVPSLSLK